MEIHLTNKIYKLSIDFYWTIVNNYNYNYNMNQEMTNLSLTIDLDFSLE